MKRSITIVGLGSLLSEESARRTCANLSNFRYATLRGYKRVFNKTDSYRAIQGDISLQDKKYACLSALPDKTIQKMFVSVFEIPVEEWAYILYREFEYRLVEIPFKELSRNYSNESTGIVCMGDYQDDLECAVAMSADPIRLERWNAFLSSFKGKMWRDDLEPCDEYLQRCVGIAKKQGSEFLDNFLDTTFLGDGRSIRVYLNET